MSNPLQCLMYLLHPRHSVGPTNPAVLSYSPWSLFYLAIVTIAPALDVAAKHVVEAEEGGSKEEEAGSKVIMETKGHIINLDIPLWSGLEEAGKANDCPKDVHHDSTK